VSGWKRLSSQGAEAIVQAESAIGWVGLLGETWTYASADAPTFVITVGGIDPSLKYTPGMRIRLTQGSGFLYFIITAVSSTTITVYGGTDYVLANAAIADMAYSMTKVPYGFPADPAKWTVTTTQTSGPSKSAPASTTWYGGALLTPTGPSIDIPIGAWHVSYEAIVDEVATTTNITLAPGMTLSTANNSASDATMTTRNWMLGNTAQTGRCLVSLFRERYLVLSSKTTYYLNVLCSGASTNNIDIRGDVATTVIRAVCAYL
jgi:hypothetical protein